jgi:hypothetical protein
MRPRTAATTSQSSFQIHWTKQLLALFLNIHLFCEVPTTSPRTAATTWPSSGCWTPRRTGRRCSRSSCTGRRASSSSTRARSRAASSSPTRTTGRWPNLRTLRPSDGWRMDMSASGSSTSTRRVMAVSSGREPVIAVSSGRESVTAVSSGIEPVMTVSSVRSAQVKTGSGGQIR